MRGHEPSELIYQGSILAPDQSVRASGVYMGVKDLDGRRLEQAQLINAETTHQVLMWHADATGKLDTACYIEVEGVLYIVDYFVDPRAPRPRMWLEVYCHAVGPRSI